MSPCLRLLTLLLAVTAGAPALAQRKEEPPTVGQALALKPIQKGVTYDTPTGEAVKRCTIKPEPEGKSTSWVVRDGSGAILRRFADANADNVVDTWCYYAAGLEVYRDVDSDFDTRADQYRWFHTGGSRWGIDKNQDTRIDYWRRISPQEVAEEAFLAVQSKDAARFERLLLTSDEARQLGLGETLADQFSERRRKAAGEFRSLLTKQEAIDAKSRFVDFGAPRPGVIPAGLDGSKKDVVVYENASALIDADGKPEQLLLGSLVQVGDGWRLVEAPRAGSNGPELANVFSVPSRGAADAAIGAPSDESQALMAELDKLDRQAASASANQRERLTDRRVEVLQKLASAASSRSEATQWHQQLAGLLNAAAQTEGYKKGVTKLAQLENSPAVRKLGKDVQAHYRYQRISAEQGIAFQDPKADVAKVQDRWIKSLEAFVRAYPQSPDAADALLQLGSSAGEIPGDLKTAQKWYRQAVAEFPNTQAGKTAAGALKRIGLLGKPFKLSGATLSGKRVNTAAAPYRGRYTLVHYWASWHTRETDFLLIEAMRKKYRGKFEVLGVNLDTDTASAKQALRGAGVQWENLYDEDGLNGERATAMGVITPPLMLLIDGKGQVVNRNLYAVELETELRRLIR